MDRLVTLEVWDDLECNGGSLVATLQLPFSADDTMDLDAEERAEFDLWALDPEFEHVVHEAVLREVFDDGDVLEWRIREIDVARETDNGIRCRVIGESPLYDLADNAYVIEMVEANGAVRKQFEMYGKTPTQHAEYIIAQAPSYFTLGTVEDITSGPFHWKEGGSVIRNRVDMMFRSDSPLSALRELAKISDLELEVVRNGGVDQTVNLLRERGSGAATVVVTHADNLMRLRRRSLSSDMGTVVYPVGGQEYGSEGSMERHSFEAATVSGSTVTFYEELFSEDDQLNTYFVVDPAGDIIEIDDTIAPSTIVLASAPDVSSHRRFGFRRAVPVEGGTVYGALTYLPSPLAIAQYGVKAATVERTDIPLIDNIVPNPMLQDDAWVGDTPAGYTLIGSPLAEKNTNPLYTRHGGASWHLTCSAPGQGAETKAIRVIPTERDPFLTGQVQLYIVAGHARLELIDVTNDQIFPPAGREASTIAEDVWIDQFGVAPGGDPDDNFFTRGTTHVKVRVTQIGPDPLEFYWDAAQLTNQPTFSEYIYGGRASNDLWLLGREALEKLITPSAEYEIELVDFHRLGDTVSYEEVVLGGQLQAVDSGLSHDVTSRILRRYRNHYWEGDTKVEVEGKTNDLTRITAQTDRRNRRKLGSGAGTTDYDGNIPDASTDNLLDCCEDATGPHASPDSAGDWENNPVCDITIADASLVAGTAIAWAADAKLDVTEADAGESGEVNAARTLKKTAQGALWHDPLDTLDNVTVVSGSASIEDGQLRVESNTWLEFTGFAAAAAVTAQVRFEAGDYPWGRIGLVARLDGSLDGYGIFDGSGDPEPGLARVDAGGTPTFLDTGVTGTGGASFPRSYLKVHAEDDYQAGHIGGGAAGGAWAYEATDATQNGQTGRVGFRVQSGGKRVLLSDLYVPPSNEVTCTGLPDGYTIRIGDATSGAAAGGSATVDLGSVTLPAATLYVLNGATIAASITPNSGIFGGNTFVYDAAGTLTGGSSYDSETRVDLDFLDSGGSLISTATWATGAQGASYERLGGTTTIPASTATIRVMHRRNGTAAAISTIRHVMVVVGTTIPTWVPCEIDAIISPAVVSHVVPTDEAKVVDLRFTEKYPKIDTDTNGAGSEDPKTDGDGTIALSRRVWDASIHGLHHHLSTEDGWAIGPDGLTQDPNPDGDWVHDWPLPVPGVRGWASRIPSYFDWKNVSGGVSTDYLPSGCYAYFPDDIADIRGPAGQFDQMENFTYLIWFRPALESDWAHPLAAVWSGTAGGPTLDATLGISFEEEKAGWQWLYEFYPGSGHYISFLSQRSAAVDDIYYESGDGGVCDPFFGEAATATLDEGGVASVPAFLALVVSAADTGIVEVGMYLGNPRTGELMDVTTGTNYGSVTASTVPVPDSFTSADNQTQHVIGNTRQRRQQSLYHGASTEGAHGIFDAAVRHNRALTLPEIRGAFLAGQRHEWERSTPLIVADVDNTGEAAAEVSAP